MINLSRLATRREKRKVLERLDKQRDTCAVVQQALQPCSVLCGDAHTGVYRKTAVAVSQHLFSIETFEQSPTYKGAQDSPAECGLHLGDSIRTHARAGVKADARW